MERTNHDDAHLIDADLRGLERSLADLGARERELTPERVILAAERANKTIAPPALRLTHPAGTAAAERSHRRFVFAPMRMAAALALLGAVAALMLARQGSGPAERQDLIALSDEDTWEMVMTALTEDLTDGFADLIDRADELSQSLNEDWTDVQGFDEDLPEVM